MATRPRVGRGAADALALARSAVLPQKTSAWVGAATLLLAHIDVASGRLAQAQARAVEADREFSDTLAPTHPWRAEARALATPPVGHGEPSQGH